MRNPNDRHSLGTTRALRPQRQSAITEYERPVGIRWRAFFVGPPAFTSAVLRKINTAEDLASSPAVSLVSGRGGKRTFHEDVRLCGSLSKNLGGPDPRPRPFLPQLQSRRPSKRPPHFRFDALAAEI